MVDERRLDRNDMRERAAGSAKTIVLDPSALTMAGGRFIEATSDTQRRVKTCRGSIYRALYAVGWLYNQASCYAQSVVTVVKGLCKRELVNFQQWRSFRAQGFSFKKSLSPRKYVTGWRLDLFSVKNDTNNKLNLIFFDNKQQDELIELIESSPLRERNWKIYGWRGIPLIACHDYKIDEIHGYEMRDDVKVVKVGRRT